MQHVEEAGIHSGDSACVLPPHSLGPEMLDEIRAHTRGIALGLNTVGLINIQYAVTLDGRLFVIEANPRASRTVPFVSKAIGVPLAKMACRLMLGERLEDLGLPSEAMPTDHVSRQGGGPAVRPLRRLGRAAEPGDALDRRGHGRRARLPDGVRQGAGGGRRDRCRRRARSSSRVTDGDKAGAYAIASRLEDLGFRIVATAGTAQAIRGMGVRVDDVLKKVGEGSPNVVDRIEAGEIDLVINTPTGSGARADGWEIRRAAVARGDPLHHDAVGRPRRGPRDRRRARSGEPAVLSLQELHRDRLRRRMRTLAPFGRRRVARDRRRRRRRLPRPARRRPDGPGAAAGAVLHARRRRALGRGATTSGPYLPRAFSFLRAADGRAELHARGRRARDAPARASCGAGDELWLTGPLGHGFAAPARRPPRAARRRRGRRPAAGGVGARARRPTAPRSRAVLGFRDAHHAAGAALLADGDVTVATDDGSVGHHGLVTELLAARARRDDARGRLRLRAARRCSRRCARCARPATCPRSSRWRPAWPAASAPATAASCRSREGGYVRLCVDGPVLDADRLDRVPAHALIDFCGLRARAPDRQRLGHVRRDRRAARVRRRAARALPVQRLRLQDDHAGAARGQPAAAAVGGARPG